MFGIRRFRSGALPSEVFRSHVFLSFQEDALGVQLRHYVGVDNLLWGSDYPHAESTFPRSREVVAQILAGVPQRTSRPRSRGRTRRASTVSRNRALSCGVREGGTPASLRPPNLPSLSKLSASTDCYGARLMIVIIEGADLVGKSTLASEVSARTGWPIAKIRWELVGDPMSETVGMAATAIEIHSAQHHIRQGLLLLVGLRPTPWTRRLIPSRTHRPVRSRK